MGCDFINSSKKNNSQSKSSCKIYTSDAVTNKLSLLRKRLESIWGLFMLVYNINAVTFANSWQQNVIILLYIKLILVGTKYKIHCLKSYLIFLFKYLPKTSISCGYE